MGLRASFDAIKSQFELIKTPFGSLKMEAEFYKAQKLLLTRYICILMIRAVYLASING